MTESSLVQVIDALYGASLDSERWSEALTRTVSLLGGVGGTIELHTKRPVRTMQSFHVVDLPEDGGTRYADYYHQVCPRFGPILRSRPADVLCDYQHHDESAMERSEFYQDFLGPHGFRYYLSGTLENDDDRLGIFTVQRAQSQGHATARDIALARKLLPHFQRAILISERLSLRERTLDGLMELVTMGVLVLDPAGRILLANDLARTLLREHAGLRDAKSYFGLADRRLHDRFRASLASMCDSSRGSDPPAPIVLSETESHGPLVVVASPLRPDRTWLGRDLSPGTYGPLALVVLHHPRPDPDLWFDALRTHFGLTRAEAALTESLLSGRSLKEHGDQQQVSLNTVKTHWARVRSKTGCRTQAELVRRLSALLPPVRQPDRR